MGEDEGLRPEEQPGAEPELDGFEEHEVVEGVVVLAGVRTIEPREGPPALVTVAAAAATGFVAGAATAAVLGRGLSRAQARRAVRSVEAGRALRGDSTYEVVSSRRYIVDVRAVARRH
ncbi:MAG TPA: hypothetical protein VHX66_17795 [Solirubrobacteraceae bacterium]|nr:hypothetical protein [Solirubrobacteraceae bacterium]